MTDYKEANLPEVQTPDKLQAAKTFITGYVNKITGDDAESTVTFKELFSDMFRKHDKTDTDILLYSGTAVAKGQNLKWSKPFLFLRVFGLILLTYIILYAGLQMFAQINLIPAFAFVGAMLTPIPIMFFFWELNKPKTVSLINVLAVFFLGGAISLIATFLVGEFLTNGGSSLIGCIVISLTEEIGKLIAVVILCKILKSNWALTGLLIGGAVGAGFAVFETSAYISNQIYLNDSAVAMYYVSVLRAVLGVGGHVIWAAISGAAAMLVQKGKEYSVGKLSDKRFLQMFAVPIVLHAAWDYVAFNVTSTAISYALLGAFCIIGWIFVIKLINVGIREWDNRNVSV